MLAFNQHDRDILVDLLDALIISSEELNPWLPVDENTPKDRRLLLLFENGYGIVAACEGYFCNLDGGYWVESVNCDGIHPTHYEEL